MKRNTPVQKDTEWPDQLNTNCKWKRELEVKLPREKAPHNLHPVRFFPSLHRHVQAIFVPALFTLLSVDSFPILTAPLL